MEGKDKIGGAEILGINKEDISVNYLLLSETKGSESFIAFMKSDFYQSDVLVGNYSKPIILTKFENEKK